MGAFTKSLRLSGASPTALAFALALAATPIGAPVCALAQVTAANSATQVRTAGNGVPVVNIAAPNASGLSVNQYTNYNVGASGLILNNAATAGSATPGQVSTQLGGLIAINPNLATSAKTILNEVTSTNPTVLSGYTEVAGARADVIVANPNGITCGGCGFINTAALTLTTGQANLDATGKLAGFNVQAGTVTLTGAGLDATTTDYAALLGRKISLQGPINATTLDVVAGANAWDYVAHTATPIAGVGAAPDYAIDSTAVGGMYANRIRLIATEAGVGVRMLGGAAATGDDLSISAAGDIVLGADMSAQRNLTIGTTATDGAALTATNVNLTAGSGLALSTPGDVSLTGGSLVAGGDLSLSAGALTDVASASSAANANRRFAGGALMLTVTGAAALNGASYGATGDAALMTGSLSTSGFGYLYSNNGALTVGALQGDLALGGYALSSPGALTLSAVQGAVSTTAGAGEGVVGGAAPVTITAAEGLINAGTISASGGSLFLAMGGASTNSGAISAVGNLALTDEKGGATENFTNTGQFLTGGVLTASADNLNNSGTVQAKLGAAVAAAALTNSGQFTTSTDTASDGVLTVGVFSNSGTLQSARNLTLTTSGSLANSGTVTVAGALILDGGGSANNVATGVISAASAVATLPGFNNAGRFITAGDMNLTVAGDLSNSGTLGANGVLTVTAATLENLDPSTGAIAALQSQSGGSLTATQSLTNSGAIYLANAAGDGAIAAGSIANRPGGLIASQGGLGLTLSGASLDNAGTIAAANSLTIFGTGSALTVGNDANAHLQAGSAAGDSISITGTDVALNTAAGSVITGGAVNLTLASLNNAGTLSAAGALTYSTGGAVTNSGVLVAGGSLTGASASLTNQMGGGVQGGGGVSLTTAGALENDGTILTPAASGADITFTAATLVNTKGADLQSDHALTLALTGESLTNAGEISANSSLTIQGGAAPLAIVNAGTGVISAQEPAGGVAPATLTVAGPAVSLTNQAGGKIVADHMAVTLASLDNDGSFGVNLGSTTLTVADTLTNAGTLLLSANTAGTDVIDAAAIANSGTLASNGGLTLNLVSGLANSGTLQTVGDLAIVFGSNSATLQNNGSGALIASGGALSITGANTAFTAQTGAVSGASIDLGLASLINAGAVVSTGDLTVTASGAVANTGTLGAAGTLTLAVGSLSNTSTSTTPAVIQSDVGGALTVAGALDAGGSIYLANTSGAGTINAGTIKVESAGAISSQGDLTLNLSGASLDDAGLIYARNNLAIAASGVLAITDEAGGTIETAAPPISGPATPASTTGPTGLISISGTNVSLTTQGAASQTGQGGVIIGADLDWSLAGFDNQGSVESRGDLTLNSANAVQNGGTLYAKGGALTVTAAGFDNQAAAVLQGDTGATLTLAGDLTNDGTLLASTNGTGTLTVHAANLTNAAKGMIQADGGTTLALTGTLGNAGTLIASTVGTGILTATGSAFTNLATGMVQSDGGANLTFSGDVSNAGMFVSSVARTGALTIKAATLDNAAKAVLQSDTGAGITLAGDLTNEGTLIGSTGGSGALTIAAANVDIAANAQMQGHDGVALTLTGSLTNAGDLIASTPTVTPATGSTPAVSTPGTGALTVAAENFTNLKGGGVQADAGASLTLSGNFSNAGTLIGSTAGAGPVTISAARFDNAASGYVQGAAGVQLTAGGAFSNAGTILAAIGGSGALSIQAASIGNLAGGIVQGDAGATLTTTGDVTNAGTLIGSIDGASDLTINAADLSNLSPLGSAAPGVTPPTATIQSSHGLTINLTGVSVNGAPLSTLQNTGDISALGALGIHAPTSALTLTNNGGGVISAQAPAGAATPASLTIDGEATFIVNGANAGIAGDAINLTAYDLSNSGTIYSAGDVNLTANTVENLPGGVLSAKDANIYLYASLANSGEIATSGNLFVNPVNNGYQAVSVTNSAPTTPVGAYDGLIQAGGDLTLYGFVLSVTNNAGATMLGGDVKANTGLLYVSGDAVANAGVLQGAGFSNIESSGALINTGTIILTDPDPSYYALIQGSSITNSGNIQSVPNLKFYSGSSIGNTGAIASGGSLYFKAGAANINSGVWSAAGAIDIQTGADVVFNPNGKSVSSSFTLQATGQSSTLDLQSSAASSASITTAEGFDIEVDHLGMDGTASRIVGDTNGDTTSAGDSKLIVTGDLTNNGLIYAGGNLNLALTSGQLFNRSTAAISAGNNLTVTTPQYITNNGEIYAGAALTLSAASQIWNQASTTSTDPQVYAGAIAQGSIDSGGSITITTGHLLNNSNINAAGDITINAGIFGNDVVGDWSVGANVKNSVEGGNPVSDSQYNKITGVSPNPCAQTLNETCIYNVNFYYYYFANNTYSFANGLSGPNYVPQIVSNSGKLTVENFNTASNVGALLSAPSILITGNNNSTFTSNSLALESYLTKAYFYAEGTENVLYGYYGPQPPSYSVYTGGANYCGGGPANVPCTNGYQDVPFDNPSYSLTNPAGTRVGIFGSAVVAQNTAVTLVGGSTNSQLQTGTSAQAAMVNTPTSQSGVKPSSPSQTVDAADSSAAIAATSANAVGAAKGLTASSGVGGTTPLTGAALNVGTATGVAGGSIMASGLSQVAGVAAASGSAAAVTPGSSVGVTPAAAGTIVSGKAAVTLQGTTVVLPTNPNGLYVTAPSPTSQYLVETNPLYTLPVADLSSDLLAEKLGFDPDTLEERLGDANYEAYLISQQLLGATGRTLLAAYGDLNSELAGLYTNAANDASVEGLVYGQALTAQQVAGLPNDLVWMVSTVVDGRTVLAPVVYLSPATKASLVQGSGIIADNVDLNLTALNNQGGTINGAQTNSIVVAGDLNNTASGAISGGQVYLQSTGGAVNNLQGVIHGAQSAAVIAQGDINNAAGSISGANVGLKSVTGAIDLSGGTIDAAGLLAISQQKSIDITKPAAFSSTDLSLQSTGGDITIATQTQTAPTAKGFAGLVNYSTTVGPTASLNVKGSLSLQAADNVTISGADVSAGKDLSIIAGQNLSIGTVSDRQASSGAAQAGNTKTSSASSSDTQIGSTVTAGGSLYTHSGGNTTITGSALSAGAGALLNAGGALTVANATDTQQSSSTAVQKTHTGLISTGNTTKTASASSTAVASSISAGSDVVLQSGGVTNITGSNINAVGNAIIQSGGPVTIAAATDTSSSSRDYTAKGVVTSAHTSSSNTSSTEVASSITAGKDVGIVAKGDVTVQASNLTAGQNVVFDTSGHNLNIVAGQNQTTTTSLNQKSGLGVGDALYGNIKTTTTDAESTNAGSTIKAGGDLVSLGNNTALIQGSTLSAKGDGAITATNGVQILAGANTSQKTSQTVSETVLSAAHTQSASRSTNASASSSGAQSGSASVSASVKAANNDTVSLYNKTVTNTVDDTSTSVGSNLTFGKSLTIDGGKGDVTIAGSNITTGGDQIISGTNVNILAAQNTALHSTSTTSKTFGIFTENTASASASASASGKAQSGQGGASVSGSASADSLTTIGSRISTSSTTTNAVTNTGSNLTSGGNLVLKADNAVTTVGSNLTAAGVVAEEGQSISNLAAIDHTTTTSQSSQVTTGLYIDGTAKASTSAQASANAGLGVGASASGSVSAGVSATGSIGVRNQNTQSSSVSGSTTSQVSTITGGKGIVRVASGALTDQGTQLNSGGDIVQSAKTLTDLAAANTSSSSSNTLTNTFQAGVYATGAASVSAAGGAGAGGGSGAGGSAKASIGVQASDTLTTGATSNSSSSAIATRYNAAGQIVSDTTGASTFQGTTLNGAGGVAIQAASVDFQAAQNTSAQSATNRNASASVQVGLLGKADLNASVAYSQDSATKTTSTAVVGGINSSNGAVSVQTTNGGANFTGTQISGAKGVAVHATNGDVNLLAAQNTTTTSTQTAAFNADLSTSKGSGGADLGASYSQSNGLKVTNTVATINSSGGTVDVSGNNVKLQGARVSGATGASVTATAKNGTVALLEATDINKQTGGGGGINLAASKDTDTDAKTVTNTSSSAVSFNVTDIDQEHGKAASIQSGGVTTVSGAKVVSQQAAVNGASGTNIVGVETDKALTNKSIGVDLGVTATVQTKTTTPTEAAPAKAPSGGEGSSGGSTATEEESSPIPSPHSAATALTNAISKLGDSISKPGSVIGSVSAELSNDALAQYKNGAQVTKSVPGPIQEGLQRTIDVPVLSKPKISVGDTSVKPVTGSIATGSVALSSKGAPLVPVTIPTPNLPVIPAGQLASATGAKGQALPSWLKFNPVTGQLTGSPASGDLSSNKPVTLMISVPGANGGVQTVTVTVTPKQFDSAASSGG